MFYHVYNPNLSDWSAAQKFRHAVMVRNRTLGLKGVELPSYLDLEVSKDNLRFIQPPPEDLNMHQVLKDSACQHGKRRRVASRTLNALGYAGGVCGNLNDSEKVQDMKEELQFADSLNQVRRKEKDLSEASKRAAAKKREEARARKQERALAKQKKMETTAKDVLCKLGLEVNDKVTIGHLDRLTGREIDSIAWIQHSGLVLKGNVTSRRDQLKKVLHDKNLV